jgi:glycosyltransferase involved in cell wall biosynthesis
VTCLPRLTVITPSLNQCEYIEQTIESVVNQGYPDLEYLVVDGGSSDGTLDVLRKYEHALSWISEPDRGQSHAINKGLRRTTGEVVAYLNSDDLYEPGALLKVGQFFAQHPQAAWLTGKCRIIDRQGREVRKAMTLNKNLWLRLRSYTVLQVLNYVSQAATFWRREVVDEVGLFDEALRYAMDYDFFLRVGQRYRLWVLHDYLASFRVHEESKGVTSASAQFEEDLASARRYVSSPILVGMHGLSNWIVVTLYKLLTVRATDHLARR